VRGGGLLFMPYGVASPAWRLPCREVGPTARNGSATHQQAGDTISCPGVTLSAITPCYGEATVPIR